MLEDLSRNAVERLFLLAGHPVTRPSADHGIDLFVETHDAEGFLDPGFPLIQLKATEHPNRRPDGSITFRIDIRDYHAWIDELMPVLLVLYDAREDLVYWQHIQDYFGRRPECRPAPGRRTVTVSFPRGNLLDSKVIDYLRSVKNSIQATERRSP